MKLNITSRHFKAKETLLNYIKEQFSSLEKYQENILFTDVVLSYDKPPLEVKYCEIIVKLKDKIITAKEGAVEFSKAVDMSISKIDTQLYKHKDKIKSKKHIKAQRKDIIKPKNEEITEEL